ncbi:MAG TPA: alpha/beta hydrolase [Nevskiaceae bacterium]|nr:alpha/beta hydrolase [Nevskiaceae bacterium]
MKRALFAAFVVALTLLAAISVPAWLHYSADMVAARARTDSDGRMLSNGCTTMEYAERGSGTPVLVVHGAGGGFDQGLAFAQSLIGSDMQVIAPSRFGYLRTPAPADVSPQAQADAFVCLLDALALERVTVIGASAGAPSATQFCIRHAERCRALILLVPAAYSPAHAQKTMQTSRALQIVFDHVLSSDAVFWSMSRLWPGLLMRTVLGTPTAVFEQASDAERKRALAILDGIQPVHARARGLQIDARVTNALPRYDLERIVAPTLAISLEDDLYGTFDNAAYSASQIAGAKFLSYPTGGHIWLGHDEELRSEIQQFVAQAP